jgi:1,2-diacylglycerol 3-alpha-glucosyltransferase
MRILITGTTYYPALNGMAIFMVNLAEGLARRGHEVAVIYPDRHGFSEVRHGVHVEAVGSIALDFIHTESYVPLPSRKIGRVFDSFRPEIVHLQDQYPLSWWVLQQAKRRGLTVMGTNHFGPGALEGYIPGRRWLKPLLDKLFWNWILAIYRQVDFVVAPSQSAVNALRAQGLKVPGAAVSCGTDLSRFYPNASLDRMAWRARYGLAPDRTLFLYVGRVDREKRLDVLLHAVSLLPRQDVQFAIAGQGAALHEIQELARSLNLGDRVRFLGKLLNEELPNLLNSADAFTMPGEAESLSIATLEAMACGLPVLLADAFALPELVAQGVNGYLFKSGDPASAAHYLGLLADQRARWKEMGRAGLERVQPHSLEYTLQRYEALYKQTLDLTLREAAPTAVAPLPLPDRKPKAVKRLL